MKTRDLVITQGWSGFSVLIYETKQTTTTLRVHHDRKVMEQMHRSVVAEFPELRNNLQLVTIE